MKKITLLAALVAIVFAPVGPATVLAADPAGSEPKSPEAIASPDGSSSDAHETLSRSFGQVTGLLLFFGGSQPLLVLRLSGKESAGLLFGATFAWIAACPLMRM